jgi:GT2 family glycosyltransferase
VNASVEDRLSIVVLTYNRVDEVLRTLACLCRLPERPPIIVVDNGSADGTAAQIAEHFPQVELVRSEANLGAAGRNLGVERVRTPFVAFCDDDTCWEPGALALAADLLEHHPQVAVLSCRVVVGASGEPDPTCALMAASPLPTDGLPGPSLIGIMAGASVFRTEAYRAVGGYEPRLFIGGEETLLSLDLLARGWRLVYAAAVVTRHQPSQIRESQLRRRLLARNAIWVAWLRLPFGAACRETLRALASHGWRKGLGTVLLQSLAGLRWVLRERSVIPAEVQRMREAVARAEREGARVAKPAPSRTTPALLPAPQNPTPCDSRRR